MGAGSLNPGRPFEDGEDVGVRGHLLCGVKHVGTCPSLQGVMRAFGPKRLVFGTCSGSSCN